MKLTHIAVRDKGEIYSLPIPSSHDKVRRHFALRTNHAERGFLDQNGNWHDRESAMRIAKKSGQVQAMYRDGVSLYSHMLKG